MKITKYIIGLLFILLPTSIAYSAESVAVLDVIKLLKNSDAAVSMKDQLNSIAKKYTEEDQKQKKEIQKQH